MCKHCPRPLSTACLAEHINELPQNVAQLREQLHDLGRLCLEKQTMVDVAVVEAEDDVKDYFQNFQNELVDTSHTIVRELENEKQKAKVSATTIKLLHIESSFRHTWNRFVRS